MTDLEFGGRIRKPDIRWLFDMLEVIYDKSWLSKAENIELYYMYRDLYLSNADKAKLLDQNLRYDITIIPPRMLGIEYVKTAGHYHPLPPGGTATYPEIYELLEGEAIYLLQNQNMSDVVAVYATAGDKIMVPPNYGHITINRSNKMLKMSNLVARDFSSMYDPYRERGGGAYFYTTQGFIKNERCPEAAEIRRIEAPDNSKLKKLGMSKGKEIYPLIKESGLLDYLVHPGEHPELFEGLI